MDAVIRLKDEKRLIFRDAYRRIHGFEKSGISRKAKSLSSVHPVIRPVAKLCRSIYGGTVFEITWIPCHFPTFMEKVLDTQGTMFFLIAVRKKHVCVRIQTAGNNIVFLAHFHDGMSDSDASVLMPFGICDIHCIVYKIKILLCEVPYFLRPHPGGVLKPEKTAVVYVRRGFHLSCG